MGYANDIVNIRNGGLNGWKNVLINGDFRVNQRGFNGGWPGYSGYGYDRWHTFDSGVTIQQSVEELNWIVGQQYTLSWLGGGSGSVWNANGSGLGSGTSPLTFIMDLISGFGAPGVGVPFDAMDVQLELGPNATPFERRDYGLELLLCQRYYLQEFASSYGSYAWGYVHGTTEARVIAAIPVTMRADPVLTTTLGNLSVKTANGDYSVQSLISAPQIIGASVQMRFGISGAEADDPCVVRSSGAASVLDAEL